MKKTLIALVALAGFAVGAEEYTADLVWTADFGSAYTGGYQTTGLDNVGTVWDAADIATPDGAQTRSNKRIHMADGTYGDWEKDFQYTMALTLTGESITAGHISEIKAGSTGKWLCLGVDASGALTLSGSSLSDKTASGTVSVGEKYDFVITKIGDTLTMTAGDASVSATLNSFSGVINNITLGGNTGSGNRVPVLVSGITWSNVVPEPATATLSLLALAGLAARRKRH